MELQGMTVDQLCEVMKFVETHHKFAKWISDEERKIEKATYPKISEHGLNIKYVDAILDTRTNDVWSVTFRGFEKLCFATNSFINIKPKNFPFTTLYDWVMAFLKEEWRDEKVIRLIQVKDND
jgi:hypothetical protein